MLVCTAPDLVTWRPDFSSPGLASPKWTRVVCDGEELTNALEDVEWSDEPAVQVLLCEACGFAGCASGGYVHVSRLGAHVLWTAPRVDPKDPFESHQYRASEPVRRHGGVAIPIEEWTSWRQRVDALPAPDDLPRTQRRDLSSAWQSQAPLFGRFEAREAIVRVARKRVVAAHPSSLDDALAGVEAVAGWFDADPDAAVVGALTVASEADAIVESLYLDVPDTFDRARLREWNAIAWVGGAASPLFAGRLLLVPPP